MDDLIEALTIFGKYSDTNYPTRCEHDTLYICVSPEDLDDLKDIDRLDELGFFISDDEDCFISYRFGNAWWTRIGGPLLLKRRGQGRSQPGG